MQVEIVRFRTDAKSVGDVIVERAASLKAAAVVSMCPSAATFLSLSAQLSSDADMIALVCMTVLLRNGCINNALASMQHI